MSHQGDTPSAASRLARAAAFLRAQGAMFAVEVLVNFVLPYVIFAALQPRWGDVSALLASSGPPIAWSILEFLRHRRVDALSLLVLLGIVLSVLAVFGGGSIVFLQLRERLVTILIALIFLGSAALGRPLIYELARATLARAQNTSDLERVTALRNDPHFRASMMTMTWIWGLGLLADGSAAIALVFLLPIRVYLIVNAILGYVTMGSLALWNVWYVRRMRRRGEARHAAAAAATDK
jgi:hypothetical protein